VPQRAQACRQSGDVLARVERFCAITDDGDVEAAHADVIPGVGYGRNTRAFLAHGIGTTFMEEAA
jgi:hypothetical protein